MDLFQMHRLFQDVVHCRNRYHPHEKDKFIHSLGELFSYNLPQFDQLVDFYKAVDIQNEPADLIIESYQTVDEVFGIVQHIFFNAVYSDTQIAYKSMQQELAALFTPMVLKRNAE